MIYLGHGGLGLRMNSDEGELGNAGHHAVGAEAGDERLPDKIIPDIVVHQALLQNIQNSVLL